MYKSFNLGSGMVKVLFALMRILLWLGFGSFVVDSWWVKRGQ